MFSLSSRVNKHYYHWYKHWFNTTACTYDNRDTYIAAEL